MSKRLSQGALPLAVYRFRFRREPGLPILKLSDRLADALGYERHEFAAARRKLQDLLPPDAAASPEELEQRVLSGARFELRGTDGRHVFLQFLPPGPDDDTMVDSVLAPLAIDIGRQRKMEHELDRLRLIAAKSESLSGVGSWFVDLRTGETYWSAQTHRLLGRAAEEPAPDRDSLLEAFSGAERKRVAAALDRALESDEAVEVSAAVGGRTVELRIEADRGRAGRPVRLVGVVSEAARTRG